MVPDEKTPRLELAHCRQNFQVVIFTVLFCGLYAVFGHAHGCRHISQGDQKLFGWNKQIYIGVSDFSPQGCSNTFEGWHYAFS